MKRKTLVGITLTALVLTGCTAQEESYYVQNKDDAYYDMGYNVYENGLIYTQTSASGKQAYFLDYETMNSVPLCNKPNCTHGSASCISKLAFSSSLLSVIHQDYVYWFSTDWEIVDSEDGKSQEPEILTKCMRAQISTGEVETFAEIEGVFMNSAIDMVIADDVLYIIGSYEMQQDEDGTWWGAGRSGAQYLYSIDLQTAEVQNHGRVNDSPYAENSWMHGSSVFSEVQIDGIYNGKLYMHYQYVDDPQIMIDFINRNEPEIPDDFPWLYENKCFDLETGEMTVSDLPYAWWIYDNTYVYLEDDTFYVMDESGDSVAAPNIKEDDIYNVTLVNDKLWKCTSGGGFDPKTGEEITLADKYTDFGAWVMDYVNDRYVVQYFDEDYKIQFDFVTEEELRGEQE